jgi:transcriptional regulator with XRE-family HTH domain
MTVGERLKKLRTEKGLSQQELSKQIGINRSTYARYETNDNQADYETLQKLADFFSTSVDYLLGRTDDAHFVSTATEAAQSAAAGQFYPAGPSDLHRLIRDAKALQFDGEQWQLDEEERQDLLRHVRLALLLIKDRRQEKSAAGKIKKK